MACFDSWSKVVVIENTTESRRSFEDAAVKAGGGYNAEEVVLEANHVSSLLEGSCIALDDGTSIKFITVANTARMKITSEQER